MKKLIFTSFLLTLGISNFANASFPDVQVSNPNKLAIDYLEKTEIVNGYSDGLFKPNLEINRAEALKILMLSEGFDESSANLNNCFPDVRDEWFAPYVCYAKEQGWVNGYGDGYFRPADSVSFEEILKMAIKTQKIAIEPSQDSNKWYEPYFNKAFELEIIDSKDLSLLNTKTLRGEVAEIIFRAIVINKMNAEKYTAVLGQTLFDQISQTGNGNNSSVNPKISFNNKSDGDLNISKSSIDQILWQSEAIPSDGDITLQQIEFLEEGNTSSFSNFSLYLNDSLVANAEIKNNKLTFTGLDIVLNKNTNYLFQLKADIENANYSVSDKICGSFSLNVSGLKFQESNVEIMNANKINGNNICLEALGVSLDRLKYVENPDPQIILPNSKNIFVGALQFKGEIEPVNINDLTIVIEEIDTTGIYNSSNPDILGDVNAIESVALCYSDGTPVLTKAGQNAATSALANKKALFIGLDLQLGRLVEQSIIIDVSLYDSTIAETGMAFKVKMSLDNNDCDITGITSGDSYSCNSIVKDIAKIEGNENYVLENSLSVAKTDNQSTSLYTTQDVEALKFQLIPKNNNDVFFTEIKNMNVSCTGTVKITKASVYAGSNLLGSTSGADLCGQEVDINFPAIDPIQRDGEVYIVKVDAENISTDDSINVSLNLNGSHPGNDDICWQTYDQIKKNYLEVCWINMPEDKSFTFIENKIRR